MSLYALAAGALSADPRRREGAKGPFATATLRVATDGDEAILVPIIAFAEAAERLLEQVKGDSLAVSGRARLTHWIGRDDAERHGLSLVAEQIASAKPRRAAPNGANAAAGNRASPARSALQRAPARSDAGDGRPFNDEIPI
jgi:single-stranded DNA-binding protein